MQYFIKIVSTVLNLVFNFIVSSLLPKFLGPTNFGIYDFINNQLNSFFSFIDFGTSSYYFTNLSKNPSNIKLIKNYLIYTCIVALLVILGFIIIINFDLPFFDKLGIGRNIVFYAVILAFLTWVLNNIRYTYDALNLTNNGELIWVLLKLFLVLGLIIIYQFCNISLELLYLKDLIIISVFLIIFFNMIIKKIKSMKEIVMTNQYMASMFKYIRPLILLSIINLVASSIDRIVLMKFSPISEQGFYSIAFRISQLAVIFSGPLMQLFHRNLSSSIDISKDRTIFESNLGWMFSITTLISFVIYFNTEFIIHFFGGSEYVYAVPVLSILAFYPSYQVYGQISSTYFLSKSFTLKYTYINMFSLILGLILLWIFIAPINLFGLDMKSKGLAYKMVLSNIIVSNYSMYFILKNLRLSFPKFIYNQLKIILLMFCGGWTIFKIINLISFNGYLKFTIGAGIYFLVMFFLLLKFANFFSLKNQFVINWLRKIKLK